MFFERVGRLNLGMRGIYFRGPGGGGATTPKLATLSLPQQLDALRAKKYIPWKQVPSATQKHLVELLAKKAGVSVYQLKEAHYFGDHKRGIKPLIIDEIGKSLRGFYSIIKIDPNRKGKNTCEYILESLGFPAFYSLPLTERDQLGAARKTLPDNFASLPIEQQLHILKEMLLIPWQDIPIPTQRHLVELLAKKAGISVYQLDQAHYFGDGKQGIKPLIIDEIGKNLAGFYRTMSRDPNKKRKSTCKFILETLGYGSPPFNRAGRLFASSRAKHISHSLFILLSKLRQLLRTYTACEGKILELSANNILALIGKDPEYQGVVNPLRGLNIFSYSLIELICRALQHSALDELGMEGSPNYLREELFSGWTNVHKIKSSKKGGYYQATLQTAQELPWLLSALEKVKQGVVNGGEDEGFASLWLDTQIKLLKIIIAKNKLTPPLACALGKFNYGNIFVPLENSEAQTDPLLDDAQSAAAKMILNDANPLLVVHGPAGSGKTTLLLNAVDQLVRSGKKVLYVTPTHKAADVFMGKLNNTVKMRDLPAVRLASRKSIEEGKVSEVSANYWVGDESSRRHFGEKRNKVKGALYVGTIAAGVRYVIDPPKATAGEISEYDVVIIDEASMAAKAEAYSILSFAKRAVLVGDHVQLEPFGLSREVSGQLGFNENQKERVERSLLEELMFADYAHILLGKNYRAINPAMIVLASRIFYDERILINHNSPYFTLPPEERRKQYPADSLKVVDTSNLPYVAKKEEKDFNSSYFNEQEANLVVSEYKQYLAQGFKPGEIAVITPYRGQVNLIRSKLANELGIPYAVLQKWVSTFDSFQGDENKCVIISFVRSNLKEPPETGFVGNYHRVNVGLTRAEERMSIIGDFATLKKTGNSHADQELSGNLDEQTRHIFEEIEFQILELEQEKKAVWLKPRF